MRGSKGNRVLMILNIIFILWGAYLIISWLDVILHNLTTYQYAPWNFFELLGRFLCR